MGNILENFTESEIVEIVKGAGKELIDLGEKAGDAFCNLVDKVLGDK